MLRQKSKKGKLLVIVVLCLGISLSLVSLGNAAKVTLDFPSWWFAMFPTMMEPLVAEYEKKYPDVKINGYDVPYPDYPDRMSTRLAANDPPDVMMVTSGHIPYNKYVELGLLEPLNKWMEKTSYWQNCVAAQKSPPVEVDGRVYILVLLADISAPMYMTNAYGEAGVEIPKTTEEMLEVFKKLTRDKDGDGLIDQYGYASHLAPGNFGEWYWELSIWFIGYGNTHVAKDGKLNLTDADMIKAMKMYKQIYDWNIVPKGQDKSTYRRMFTEGVVATLLDGSYMYGVTLDETPENCQYFDTYPLPFETDKICFSFEGLVIPSGAPHKQEAWNLLGMWSEKKWMEHMIRTSFVTSSRTDVYSEEFLDEYPWFRVYQDETAKRKAIERVPPGFEAEVEEITRVLASWMEEVIFNDVPVEKAMENAQRELEDLLFME